MKKLCFFILVIFSIPLCASIAWDGSASIWSSGSGTELDPYLIESPSQLAYISEMVASGLSSYHNVSFKQTEDFVMGSEHDWQPIGNSDSSYFCGNYDGNGYTISDLSVVTSGNYAGLFGHIQESKLKNIIIRTATFSSFVFGNNRYCGAIVGMAKNSQIIQCSVESDIICGHEYTGGIAGYLNCSKLINCTKGQSISVSGSFGLENGPKVGGIAGCCRNNSEILACYNKGNVSGSGYYSRVGGIVGYCSYSNVTYCYCTSIIEGFAGGDGGQKIGGLSGQGGFFNNCYFSGSIIGSVTYAIGVNVICTNTYYISSCDAIYASVGISKSETIMKSPLFVNILNRDSYSFFEYDSLNQNLGYPILSFQNGHIPIKNTVTSICQGDSLFWEDTVFTKSIDTTHVYGTVDYIDSISILELTVNPTYGFLTIDTILIHDYYTFDGESKKYDIPGMNYDSHLYVTQSGCDSLFSLELMVIDTTHYNIYLESNDSNLGCVDGGGRYLNKDTITIKAIPNDHCLFAGWSDGNMDSVRQIIVQGDITLVAVFAKEQYLVTTLGENGIVIGGGTYDYGSQVILTAVADEHYHFVGWSDSVKSTTRSILVSKDTTFIAEFVIDCFTITTSAIHGSVTGAGTYDYGTIITLSAIPDEHYHFVGWGDGETDTIRVVEVTDSASYVAVFAIDQFIISADGNNGSILGTGVYDYGTDIILTATANEHYHFVSWLDGVNTATRNVTVLEDKSYTAIFAIDQFTIDISAVNGSVTGAGTYDYGTKVTLIAIPDEHYHFVRWGDGAIISTRIVEVTNDSLFTAEFAIDQFVIVTNGTNGTILGAGTYDYGTEVILTANPDEHYHFVQWSDGEQNSIRRVVVVTDATYDAEFDINQYSIVAKSANEQFGSVTGEGQYDYNSSAIITATPEYGYDFTKWNDGDTNNPRVVMVIADSQYIAIFTPKQFTITALSADETMGTINGGGKYTYNTEAVITAVSNSGYSFTMWNDGNTNNPRTLLVTEDYVLIANFAPSTNLQDNTSTDSHSNKININGHIYILRDGKTYTIEGQEVK